MNDTSTPTERGDRGDATRRGLIEAAIVEFARDGFHAASIPAACYRNVPAP